MAELPPLIQKILAEETDTEQPVSSAWAQKSGSSLNGLIGILENFDTFTANDTFVVPLNVSRLYFVGCGGGGGGGGGGGATEPDNRSAGGGAGGAGSALQRTRIPVTPGQTLTITVGAGGTAGTGGPSGGTNGGNGGNGGDTIITGFATGEIQEIRFPGGVGGQGGRHPGQISSTPSQSTAGTTYVTSIRDGAPVWPGGNGGGTFSGTSETGLPAATETSVTGGTITGAVGGIGGAQSGGGLGGGGGGGGGSSNFGSGGAGGRGADNGSANNVAGTAALATNYGAAGGGGGGGSEALSVAGQPGGAGASGILYIMF